MDPFRDYNKLPDKYADKTEEVKESILERHLADTQIKPLLDLNTARAVWEEQLNRKVRCAEISGPNFEWVDYISAKRHSSYASIDQLKPIMLCEMQKSKVYKGRYLLCSPILDPDPVVSLQTLVADTDGLSKISFRKKSLKIWATTFFAKKKYVEATTVYNMGLQNFPDNPVLYLNKASSLLRSGYFYDAYEAAAKGKAKGGDRKKAFFRMGLAAYGLRDWQLAINQFNQVLLEFPDCEDTIAELKRAEARLKESQTGKFDFKSMLLQVQDGKREIDVADYTGPIEVEELFSLKTLKEGTLLAVCKAFSTGYMRDIKRQVLIVDLIRNRQFGAAQKLHITRTCERLQQNPHRTSEFYKLYSGDIDRNVEVPDGIVDIERVEQICFYNSFNSAQLELNDEKKTLGGLAIEYSMLFLLPAYINHSCAASAHRVFYGDVIAIYALEDMKEGEEVTLAYTSPLDEYSIRQKILKDTYGFECKCELCELDSKDDKCAERAEIFKSFSTFADKTNNYAEAIEVGKKQLEKMRELSAHRSKFKLDLAQLLFRMSCLCTKAKNYTDTKFYP
ncbi:SET domain-containing protein [Aphelenchoides bicaudatus]|nr:SET domain-containing protein [Aphelenchoides bicaudatus]